MHWLIQTHRCSETGHRSAGVSFTEIPLLLKWL